MAKRFCPETCLCLDNCVYPSCLHHQDVVYRHPKPATFHIGGRVKDITIVGENVSGTIDHNSGKTLGQKWYLSDGTSIQFRNPLVKFR